LSGAACGQHWMRFLRGKGGGKVSGIYRPLYSARENNRKMSQNHSEKADRELLRTRAETHPEEAEQARKRVRLASELKDMLAELQIGRGAWRQSVADILVAGRELEKLAPDYEFEGRDRYAKLKEDYGWMEIDETERICEWLDKLSADQPLLSHPAYYESTLAAALSRETSDEQQGVAKLHSLLGALDKVLSRELSLEYILQEHVRHPEHKNVLRRAEKLLCRRDQLLALLKSESPLEKFPQIYNSTIVRLFKSTFEPYRDRLVELGKARLCLPEVIGLGPAVAQESVVWKEDGGNPYYRIRWTWPHRAFSTKCRIYVRPASEEEENNELPNEHISVTSSSSLVSEITPSEWEQADFCCQLLGELVREGQIVEVRAVIDLVFEEIVSKAVVLGRLTRPRRSLAWHKGLRACITVNKRGASPESQP